VGSLAREHVTPVSRGGGYTTLNIVPSCARCNSKKGARTPDEAGIQLHRVPLKQMDLF
jgi:5-methylcytosine-specific restriction endonuclease McrA